jgi:ketosteroid isomerase-like protein
MVATTPADVDRLFAERLSAGDLDGALAMYEAEAVYIDGDGIESRGHEAIRATLAELIAMQGSLDCYEIDVSENGNLAVLRARWVFTGVDPNGAPFESRGRSIEVVRRQPDGTWLFTIDLPNGAT